MHNRDILFGLGIAVLLAVAASFFASSWPDGLERVAAQKGFLDAGAGSPVFVAPLAEYCWPGMRHARLAVVAAAVAGTLVVFGAVLAMSALLRRRDTHAACVPRRIQQQG